jgi:FkbM family methyltransferase
MEHFVENMLKHITSHTGFFIECGANDGIIQSYTLELEKKGWRGLLIEPSPYIFPTLKVNRNEENIFYNCALVASDDVTELWGDFDGSPMSSVGGKRLERPAHTKVQCRTLNSVLEEIGNPQIDLFSLDVEGYELEVLKGFDIAKYRPTFVIIEVYNEIRDNIFDFMMGNGYVVLSNLTGYDHATAPKWKESYNDYLFMRYDKQ